MSVLGCVDDEVWNESVIFQHVSRSSPFFVIRVRRFHLKYEGSLVMFSIVSIRARNTTKIAILSCVSRKKQKQFFEKMYIQDDLSNGFESECVSLI